MFESKLSPCRDFRSTDSGSKMNLKLTRWTIKCRPAMIPYRRAIASIYKHDATIYRTCQIHMLISYRGPDTGPIK